MSVAKQKGVWASLSLPRARAPNRARNRNDPSSTSTITISTSTSRSKRLGSPITETRGAALLSGEHGLPARWSAESPPTNFRSGDMVENVRGSSNRSVLLENLSPSSGKRSTMQDKDRPPNFSPTLQIMSRRQKFVAADCRDQRAGSPCSPEPSAQPVGLVRRAKRGRPPAGSCRRSLRSLFARVGGDSLGGNRRARLTMAAIPVAAARERRR